MTASPRGCRPVVISPNGDMHGRSGLFSCKERAVGSFGRMEAGGGGGEIRCCCDDVERV